MGQKIPREIKTEYSEFKDRVKAAKKQGADIILDFWGEQIPQPAVNALADGGTWAYTNLGFDLNYAKLKAGCTRPVIVFIFDTGGKYTHTGLQDAARNDLGRTFTGEAAPDDGNGHSTHCAGTYGGTHPNGLNVGLCKAMVDKKLIGIVPVKVLSNGGSGSFTWIENGIAYANGVARSLVQQGYGVVYSFSLGGGTEIYQPVAAKLKEAADMGVIVVAAAGNTGSEGVQYPGADPSAQAIAALELVNGQMQWVYFSTFGAKVFEASPGHQIFSTYPPNDYVNLSGTSMATPAAGAVFATLLSYFPRATTAQILSYVEKTLTDLPPTGRDPKTGFGVPIMTRLLSGSPGGENPPPPPSCGTPSDNQVQISSVTASSATFACSASATAFLWRWRPQGTATWANNETIKGIVAATGLQSNTTYEMQVAVKCSLGQSGYSTVKTFKTIGSVPILPVKPETWVANLAIPPGDTYWQSWKTNGQTQTQQLKIRGLAFEVSTNLYGEAIYDLIQKTVSGFFKNSMLVVRDKDDYVTTTGWVAHFLRMHVERELITYNVKIRVTKITGEDTMARYCEFVNPIMPLVLEVDPVVWSQDAVEPVKWWHEY